MTAPAWQVKEELETALTNGKLPRALDYEIRYRVVPPAGYRVAELPKPLQVSAFGRKDWNLASDWYRWTFVAARESK